MQRRLTTTLAATLLLVTAWPALASGMDDRVDHRQERQDQRIDQGVTSGELTRPEAHRLRREQRHVARLERRSEADGTLSRREALRLEKAQDRSSRHIARAKHDGQSRP